MQHVYPKGRLIHRVFHKCLIRLPEPREMKVRAPVKPELLHDHGLGNPQLLLNNNTRKLLVNEKRNEKVTYKGKMKQVGDIFHGNPHLIKWKMKGGYLLMSSLNKSGQWSVKYGQQIIHQRKQNNINDNLSDIIRHLDI